MKNTIITAALENAALFIGTDYSRDKRDYIWPPGSGPGGSMDCSSFTAAIFAAAGYPLLDGSGNELRTSCYQVNAIGFDLVYPEARTRIGKTLPSPKGLLSSIAQPGDIVFWNFDPATTRANKITHVGTVDKDNQIIHTANNREKCCRKPLTYGDGSICAVIRLREDVAPPTLPDIRRPTESSTRPETWQVRTLQAVLNMRRGERLTVDGIFGTGTETAVEAVNDAIGKPGKVCTGDTWAALGLLGTSVPVVEPEPPAPPASGRPYHAICSGGSVYVRAGRDKQSGIFGTVYKDDRLPALPEKSGWCEVAAALDGHLQVGFMSGKYVDGV